MRAAPCAALRPTESLLEKRVGPGLPDCLPCSKPAGRRMSLLVPRVRSLSYAPKERRTRPRTEKSSAALMAEDLGGIVGRILTAFVLAAGLTWVFVYFRTRDSERAKRAVLSWRTIVLAILLMFLSAVARVGDSTASENSKGAAGASSAVAWSGWTRGRARFRHLGRCPNDAKRSA